MVELRITVREYVSGKLGIRTKPMLDADVTENEWARIRDIERKVVERIVPDVVENVLVAWSDPDDVPLKECRKPMLDAFKRVAGICRAAGGCTLCPFHEDEGRCMFYDLEPQDWNLQRISQALEDEYEEV